MEMSNWVHKGILSNLPDKNNAIENTAFAMRSDIVSRKYEVKDDI